MIVMALWSQFNLFQSMGFCILRYEFLDFGFQHFIQINCLQGSLPGYALGFGLEDFFTGASAVSEC